MLPVGAVIAVVGVLATLPDLLPVVAIGVALLTTGFFVIHGVASGWVPARAHAAGVSTGQAASLYLFSFYLGSSTFGSLAGTAYDALGWPGVVALATLLLLVSGTLARGLRRTTPLVPVAA